MSTEVLVVIELDDPGFWTPEQMDGKQLPLGITQIHLDFDWGLGVVTAACVAHPYWIHSEYSHI